MYFYSGPANPIGNSSQTICSGGRLLVARKQSAQNGRPFSLFSLAVELIQHGETEKRGKINYGYQSRLPLMTLAARKMEQHGRMPDRIKPSRQVTFKINRAPKIHPLNPPPPLKQ